MIRKPSEPAIWSVLGVGAAAGATAAYTAGFAIMGIVITATAVAKILSYHYYQKALKEQKDCTETALSKANKICWIFSVNASLCGAFAGYTVAQQVTFVAIKIILGSIAGFFAAYLAVICTFRLSGILIKPFLKS